MKQNIDTIIENTINQYMVNETWYKPWTWGKNNPSNYGPQQGDVNHPNGGNNKQQGKSEKVTMTVTKEPSGQMTATDSQGDEYGLTPKGKTNQQQQQGNTPQQQNGEQGQGQNGAQGNAQQQGAQNGNKRPQVLNLEEENPITNALRRLINFGTIRNSYRVQHLISDLEYLDL